jgi:23S rRNA (cytosine1962-C5)-methyltransferase
VSDKPTIRLKRDKDRSLRRRHPWVFSGAIASVEGSPAAGDVVAIHDADDRFIAWGYYNTASKIQARVLDWQKSATIDDEWWRRRLLGAVGARDREPSLRDATACRLVFSEVDGLPGLIVDRYGAFVVTQCLTAGIERVRPLLYDLLEEIVRPEGIFDRSDAETRTLEGLEPVSGPARGASPEGLVGVREGASAFLIDIAKGHKTGFYLDQRENRAIVSGYAAGRDVLDLFSYTGAFAVCALRGGARHVTLVESSAEAIAVARRNLEVNEIDPSRFEIVQGNAFEMVRAFRNQGRRFGMVICDPPKLAQTKTHLANAERAYKDINLVAMGVLEPDGLLATFSCSGAVGVEHFSRIVAWASIDAHRDVQIVRRLAQAADHPINPCFPESEYLKGVLCRVA